MERGVRERYLTSLVPQLALKGGHLCLQPTLLRDKNVYCLSMSLREGECGGEGGGVCGEGGRVYAWGREDNGGPGSSSDSEHLSLPAPAAEGSSGPACSPPACSVASEGEGHCMWQVTGRAHVPVSM